MVSLAHPASTATLAMTKVCLTPGGRVFVGRGGGNVGSAAVTLTTGPARRTGCARNSPRAALYTREAHERMENGEATGRTLLRP